jgi:hypothetical protein
MNIKIDWLSTISAIAITVIILMFPFINTCSGELLVCNDTIDGLTVVDYYGLKIVLP